MRHPPFRSHHHRNSIGRTGSGWFAAGAPWAAASGANGWSGSGGACAQRPLPGGAYRFWWWQPASRSLTDAAITPTVDAAKSDPETEESPEIRRKRTEAVLFLHRGPVNLRKLASLAGLADATEARTRIRELNRIYDESASALRVEEVAGGHQIFTRPSLAPWLRRLRHLPPSLQLGAAVMETLAIVAYRQPVLRADVEAIRGVACGELIRQLMQRDLVRICGRSEELGRPYLYGTTPRFLQLFGLKNAAAIPPLSGASIRENSDDTLANSEDHLQAAQPSAPIELSGALNLPRFESSPPVQTTLKESDVNVAPGPVVIDDISEPFQSDSAVAVLPPPSNSVRPVSAEADEDEDEVFFDDEEEDDDWDDEDDDEDDLDDDEEDEWEEVGDEDEDEDDDEEEDEVVEDDVDADEVDDVEDADEVDADEEEDDLEDDWDDEDDEDWDEEEDEDEEWD